MNQYIITEEELAEMVCDFYNGFFSAGSDIATTVRSRPYQSDATREPPGFDGYHYHKSQQKKSEDENNV